MRVKFNVNDKKLKVGDIVYCYNRPATWATPPGGGYFARVKMCSLVTTCYDVCLDELSLVAQYGASTNGIIKVDYISYRKGDAVNYNGKLCIVQNKCTQDSVRIKSFSDDSPTELILRWTDVLPLPNTKLKNKLRKVINLRRTMTDGAQ